jgi:hypothetical protein
VSEEREDTPAAKLYTEHSETNSKEFRAMVIEAAELANTIAILKNEYDVKKKALGPFIEKTGATSVLVPVDEEEYAKDPAKAEVVRVIRAKGKTTRKLSVEKLIKLGVKEGTILAAQTSTTGEPSIRITTSVTETEETEAA